MNKLRWMIARALDHLPGQCWADLTWWAIGEKRSPWSPIGYACQIDVEQTGCCYCGKLRAEQ